MRWREIMTFEYPVEFKTWMETSVEADELGWSGTYEKECDYDESKTLHAYYDHWIINVKGDTK